MISYVVRALGLSEDGGRSAKTRKKKGAEDKKATSGAPRGKKLQRTKSYDEEDYEDSDSGTSCFM